jgi:hypothetical protein
VKLVKRTKKQESTETLVSESDDSESSESDQESDSSPEKERKPRVPRVKDHVKKSREVDLSLSGICLKRFYAPQFAAVNKLKYSTVTPDVGGKSFDHLWAYPVPNPQVWRG